MEKEIGIIIPAYHAHDTIQRLLHSISIFSFIDKVAVCIVDDCDDDLREEEIWTQMCWYINTLEE